MIDTLRAIILAAGPELCDRPVYLIDGTTTGRDEPRDCHAYVSRGGFTDPHLRTLLEHRGDWQGPGSTVVVFFDRIRDAFTEDYDSRLLTTLAHEVAHLLPAVAMIADDPTPAAAEFSADLHRLFVAVPKIEKTAADLTRWDHDHHFTRRALHVWFRCRLAGLPVPLLGLCAGWRYHQSDPAQYMEILLPELAAMQAATFREIEATAPPAGFVALYESDVRTFFSQAQE
jgi:hypothetical protein